MTISSQILALDRDITLAINSCHSAAFDQFFFLFSRTQVWVFFFIVLTYVLCRTYGWRTMLSVVIAVALAVLVSDQLCNVFKYSVCRLRPTHEPSLAAVIHTVNSYVGGDYGFFACSQYCGTCHPHLACTSSSVLLSAHLLLGIAQLLVAHIPRCSLLWRHSFRTYPRQCRFPHRLYVLAEDAMVQRACEPLSEKYYYFDCQLFYHCNTVVCAAFFRCLTKKLK